MKLQFKERKTGGRLNLIVREPVLERAAMPGADDLPLLTIAWNTGSSQQLVIDEIPVNLPARSIIPLVSNQQFCFEKPGTVVAWQFNRDFYCIADHDAEVGCAGFLFYNPCDTLFIRLTEKEQENFKLLLRMFVEEMNTADSIQGEMLRVLLKRLIIKITRKAKAQLLPDNNLPEEKFDLIRRYNLLVEVYYKNEHEVQFYARQLNKSPKTLSNIFSLYHCDSPLKTIHKRIIIEAKRFFYYTDKSAKEVAYELGFADAAHFSRFFKSHTGLSPTDFRTKLHPAMH